MLPPDEVDSQATIHGQLGNIYGEVLLDYLEQAVAHWREAIRFFEVAGDLYNAALTRENVAIAYANAGRFEDALLFAHAVLRIFQQFGPAAAGKMAEVQQIIAWIERLVQGEVGG